MNLWGAPLILAAVLSGGHTGHSAGQPASTVSASESPSATSSPAAVSLPGSGAPMPVLRQVAGGSWETTALVNDAGSGCADVKPGNFRLATTAPYGMDTAQSPRRGLPAISVLSKSGTSCEVRVRFTGPAKVPAAATLIVGAGGASSAVLLTVSRDVTLFDYLWIPFLTGAAITLLSFFLSVLLLWWSSRNIRGRPSGWRDRLQRPIVGAGVWTANDSWATNISTGLVVLASIFGVTSATNAVFPGVALDRFSLVNIAAGVIVAAAPVLFGILYSWFTARNSGLIADATVKLPGLRPAVIRTPSGASITLAGDTTIVNGTTAWARVRGGDTYQIPPGADVYVISGAGAVVREADKASGREADSGKGWRDIDWARGVAKAVADYGVLDSSDPAKISQAVVRALNNKPSAGGHDEGVSEAITYAGGSDIGVFPGSTILIKSAGTLTIGASDILEPVQPAPGRIKLPKHQRRVELVRTVPASSSASDTALSQPVLIDAAGGAKITVTGQADVTLPPKTVISAPRRADYTSPRRRQLLAPQGSNLIVASLGILLGVNLLTMFGIGAELGIAGMLAYYSTASGAGLVLLFAALAVISAGMVLYAATATRAMTDPQPGSSTSSQAGASFTL